MFKFTVVFLLCANLCCARNTQVGVNNKVEGDQSVGGVHLFELHTPTGVNRTESSMSLAAPTILNRMGTLKPV